MTADDYSASDECMPYADGWLDVGAAVTVTVRGTGKSYLARVCLDADNKKCLRWNDADEIKDGDQ